MTRYAEGTQVSVERSKAEIERLVEKYGASQFFSGWAEGGAIVGFRMHNRFIRFKLPLPDRQQIEDNRQRKASVEDVMRRQTMQRWRALALVLKAKLEAVETGISDFESEFLGNITIHGGQTMAEWAKPQLDEMYSNGKVLSLMPGGGP